MPQQEYIKYLYETEELSINEISAKVGVNWRTAAKYAKRDDWNPVQATGRRRRPILEPFIDTIDVWLLEDRLLPRKDACIGETILAKLWCDKIEMLDQNQKCLAIFPRPYTLKRKPIDWPGHFAIFVRKPKGARNSILYRFLPPAVKSYLEVEPEAFRERINFSHTLLQEGYEMSFIDEALEKAGASRINDQAMIWHLLYSLSNRDKTNSGLDDDYSPPSVKNYLPLIEEYDQLMPSGQGGNTNGSIVG